MAEDGEQAPTQDSDLVQGSRFFIDTMKKKAEGREPMKFQIPPIESRPLVRPKPRLASAATRKALTRKPKSGVNDFISLDDADKPLEESKRHSSIYGTGMGLGAPGPIGSVSQETLDHMADNRAKPWWAPFE